MPDINPLTNNQIFLKKIAENTGSDYETGDVSEINPLTIDQILLKEIAANTAGQAGDISELEGKVADNTAAIEAIVNEYGACNLCPTSATTTTNHGITFTINSDGSITASGTADSGHVATLDIMPQTDLNYGTYKGSGGVNEHCRIIYGRYNSSGTLIDTVDDSGEGIELTVNASTPKVSMALIIDKGTDLTTPVIFYPMLYDARLNPTGYVPYAMTNRELTERVKFVYGNKSSTTYAANNINTYATYTVPDGYIPVGVSFCGTDTLEGQLGIVLSKPGIVRIMNMSNEARTLAVEFVVCCIKP